MNDPVISAAITYALPEGGRACFVQKMGQGCNAPWIARQFRENTKAAVPKHGFH
jgi:hypothetical protein